MRREPSEAARCLRLCRKRQTLNKLAVTKQMLVITESGEKLRVSFNKAKKKKSNFNKLFFTWIYIVQSAMTRETHGSRIYYNPKLYTFSILLLWFNGFQGLPGKLQPIAAIIHCVHYRNSQPFMLTLNSACLWTVRENPKNLDVFFLSYPRVDGKISIPSET